MAIGHSIATARDILVVKPSSFGDVIHTLPAVHSLKQAYPAARFHWVVNPEWAPLLDGNPDLASVITFPRRQLRGWRAIPGFLAWCRQTRALTPGGFDLALDFQGLFRSVLIAKGCRARHTAGLSDAREGSRFLLDSTADVSDIPHAVDRYLALARMLGGAPEATFPLPPGAPVPGLDPAVTRHAILLHPFSRGTGKSLPIDLLDASIRALAPATVILAGMGGPSGHPWPPNTLNLLNQTSIPQLVWLIRHTAATISVDSGPMHLAAAIGKPLLGLHTWSDPRKVGPWIPSSHVWKNGRTLPVAELPAAADWCTSACSWLPTLPADIAAWADTRNFKPHFT
jgi:ADP-heptose:LPS heptosyltransferase